MTREEEFATFWAAYPRKVAKGHARDAFDKAIRLTTLETMLTAISAYVRHKPDRIDFKHPATWLRAESWEDEWASVPQEITNRRRSFTDVAKDRLNGTASIPRNDPASGFFSTNQREPGPDSDRLRIGSERPITSSHH